LGQTSERVVPQQSATNLRVAGKWLKINGEAIYGTQKWKIMHEGPTNTEYGRNYRQIPKSKICVCHKII